MPGPTYVPPQLPQKIDATVTGHFDHHEAIHTFINAYRDLGARLNFLEAALAALTAQDYTVGPFSFVGTLPSALVSRMGADVILDGTIKEIRADLGVAAGSSGSVVVDVTVNGVSIFDATAGHPTITFGPTDTSLVATPAAAHATVVKGDNVRVHIVSATGAAADLVVGVIVTPT